MAVMAVMGEISGHPVHPQNPGHPLSSFANADSRRFRTSWVPWTQMRRWVGNSTNHQLFFLVNYLSLPGGTFGITDVPKDFAQANEHDEDLSKGFFDAAGNMVWMVWHMAMAWSGR